MSAFLVTSYASVIIFIASLVAFSSASVSPYRYPEIAPMPLMDALTNSLYHLSTTIKGITLTSNACLRISAASSTLLDGFPIYSPISKTPPVVFVRWPGSTLFAPQPVIPDTILFLPARAKSSSSGIPFCTLRINPSSLRYGSMEGTASLLLVFFTASMTMSNLHPASPGFFTTGTLMYRSSSSPSI
ncbi:hypothetical protein SDC9_129546 [bioreactor metagenome]|uniref:Uncharacterized protein n=1 Tax=bioreactor metagenome TaxID=1076179 RepID=A0A645D032_9ZZZZ